MEHLKLKDIGEIISGGTPSTGKQQYWSDDIAWITPADLSGYNNKYISKGRKSISYNGLKNSSAKLIPKNSVLFSSRAPIGYVAIAANELATNQGFKNIVPNSSIDTLYLYYYLKASKKLAEENASGTTFKEISSSKFVELPIPVPSLKQQQAIVSKLEELFSKLDNGIESLKTLQQQLKVYRQAVLNSLINTNNLLPISKIIEKLDQGWSPKCENEESNLQEWGVIKTTAIQHRKFLQNEHKKVPLNLKPREQHELREGDILITRAGPRIRVGVCCMVRFTRKKLLNCDKVYRIKVNPNLLSPEYLELILNTPKYLDEIEKMKSGINDSGVNLTQKAFLNMEIPVPNINKQTSIVQQIESRLSVCDKIEETITNALKEAEALRQSILKQAFEGKLTMHK